MSPRHVVEVHGSPFGERAGLRLDLAGQKIAGALHPQLPHATLAHPQKDDAARAVLLGHFDRRGLETFLPIRFFQGGAGAFHILQCPARPQIRVDDVLHLHACELPGSEDAILADVEPLRRRRRLD